MLPVFLLLILSTVAIAKENRIPIAVVDTGITFVQGRVPNWYCKGLSKDFTGYGLKDLTGHGSNVSYIIGERINPSTHCVAVLKWLHNKEKDADIQAHYNSALRYALSHFQFINLSLSGFYINLEEKAILAASIVLGKIVVVSAGNNGFDLSEDCVVYPACYGFVNKNFHVVSNHYPDWELEGSSNYGGPVTDSDIGVEVFGGGHTYTGTSQAAALITAKLARSQK